MFIPLIDAMERFPPCHPQAFAAADEDQGRWLAGEVCSHLKEIDDKQTGAFVFQQAIESLPQECIVPIIDYCVEVRHSFILPMP